MILKVAVGLIGIIVFFTGCTKIPTTKAREQNALSLLSDKTIVQKNIQTSSFTLFSLQKTTSLCNNKDMTVYIEGDGLAWITRSRISDDPTPLKPIGLSLMLSDESECKVYIARPCQYIKQDICENKYWTSHRFNTKIIQSFDEALSNLTENHKNISFTLVGYSGGGAVATLLSAKRDDVSKLITVAGNLDTQKWTEWHHISPLDGSLNPADFTTELQNTPQYHLIGENDKIVPKDIFFSYKSRFDSTENVNYKLYHATHTRSWQKHYQNFLKELKRDNK